MKEVSSWFAMEKLAQFKTLPEPVREELQSICTAWRLEKGETVAVAGAQLDHLGFVGSGTLQVHSGPVDDDALVIGLLFDGDMYGRLYDGPLRYSLSAAEDTTVCTFPRRQFEDLARQWTELDNLVIQNMQNELDAAREWLILLVPHRVAQRLAGFLLLLCKRWKSAVQLVQVDDGKLMLEVGIGRRSLAQLLGTRLESLTRAIQALNESGLIRSRSPSVFEINDLEGLVAFSGNADIIGPALLAEMRGSLSGDERPD